MQKTCIIIPCYNEELRLDIPVFVKFLKQNPYNFIFVNDGSTDATESTLLALKNDMPRKVGILNLKENMGKAEAVRRGCLKALETKSFNIVGYIDADLATPLEEIPYLLNHITGNCEIVIGSRVKRLGTSINRNFYRHYLGRIFATFSSLYLKINVYDSQCGAKFFKEKTANEIFRLPFATKWLFDLEILYRFKTIKQENFSKHILEIPLRKWEEKHNSKIKVQDFLKAPMEIIKIKQKR
jgi:dolichyl-phosphate beta-glucosyltransferase